MTKTENTTTGMRAVLGGVFGASETAASTVGENAKFRAVTPGYLPAR